MLLCCGPLLLSGGLSRADSSSGAVPAATSIVRSRALRCTARTFLREMSFYLEVSRDTSGNKTFVPYFRVSGRIIQQW